MTYELADYVAAHRQLFAHYRDLCARLGDDEMATRSLCPAWDVRAVIAHAMGVEVVLTGWTPSAEVPPPFEKMGEFGAAVAGLSHADFAARVGEVTAARLAELERLDRRQYYSATTGDWKLFSSVSGIREGRAGQLC